MASVKLWNREIDYDRLPMICIVCGCTADGKKEINFSWQPAWTTALILFGVFPLVVASVFTRRTKKVFVPLCHAHYQHWFIRNTVLFGGITVSLSLVFLGAFMNSESDEVARFSIYPFFAGGITCLITLCAAAIMRSVGVVPTEITDESLTLGRVHKAFVDARDENRLRADAIRARRQQESHDDRRRNVGLSRHDDD